MVTEGQIENAKLLAKDIKTSIDKYNKLNNLSNYLSSISLKIPLCSTLKEVNDLFINKEIIPIINNPSSDNFIQKIYDLSKNNNESSDIYKNEAFDYINEKEDEEEFFNKILQEVGVKPDKEKVGECKEEIEIQFNNVLKRKANSKNSNNGI